VFPGCCIRFEDQKGSDAIRLLNPKSGSWVIADLRRIG
jgi:hypothetical protein